MFFKIFVILLVINLCKSNPPGACCDDDDWTIFNNTAITDINAQIEKCARDCLTEKECTFRCIHEQVHLTEACTSCYIMQGECIKSNCLVVCTLNPHGKSCQDCADKHCTPAFRQCSDPGYVCVPKKPPGY